MLSFYSVTKFSVALFMYIRPRIFSLFLRLLEFYAFNEPFKHFFSALVNIRRNYSLNFVYGATSKCVYKTSNIFTWTKR
jgi:hypothetical protein